MSDFFNPISNPAGGFSMNKPVDRTKLTIGPNSSLSNIFGGQAPISQKFRDLGAQLQVNPQSGQLGPRPVSAAPAAGPSIARGGPPAAMAPAMAPAAMAPAMAPAPETAPAVPSQWMKPDGTFFTPDEVAGNIANTLKQRGGQGDVGTMAGNQFSTVKKTPEQLSAEARILQNAQGDIASGAEDPFGIASDSGIAYSPQELQAIESAYAGIYDPAITTAMAKVEQRRGQDEAAAAAETATAKAEAEFQNDLTILGKKHGYDLEKMKGDQEFQMKLAGYKASLAASAAAVKAGGKAGGSGENPDYVIKQSTVAIRSIDNLMAKINGETSGMFNSASNPIFRQIFGGLAGSDARDVVTSREALEAIVGFDTLNDMRQSAASGASGLGQVTERELKYLQSVQGSLNELQSNTQLSATLAKVRESFALIQAEADAGGGASAGAGQAPGGSKILVSATGESFDASDLTPAEYQEAIADGYKPK